MFGNKKKTVFSSLKKLIEKDASSWTMPAEDVCWHSTTKIGFGITGTIAVPYINSDKASVRLGTRVEMSIEEYTDLYNCLYKNVIKNFVQDKNENFNKSIISIIESYFSLYY